MFPGNKTRPLLGTGNGSLDLILGGGLAAHRVYLVEGSPGTGKTTLALEFLREGVRNGERVLHVTLSETLDELAAVAESHGWTLDGIEVFELSPPELSLERDVRYSMYEPPEVELIESTKAVLARVEQVKPSRVVFDSLAEMQLLAQTPLRFRRQVLALKQYFAGKQCTVLLLNDRLHDEHGSQQLHSIAHGVVQLERLSPEFGAARRRLQVIKVRGMDFRGGYHDFAIRRGGLAVFPRLVGSEPARHLAEGTVKSGIVGLDRLLDGGIRPGRSVLLLGPAGTGKSSLAVQCAVHAARSGGNAAIFEFDETLEALAERSAGLGMDLAAHLESGRVRLEDIDPAEMSPGEFIQLVRRTADAWEGMPGDKVVVIDSLIGFLYAMPEERFLIVQLRELLTYLSRRGVVSILTLAQHGFLGHRLGNSIDASYIADTVIVLRYYEAGDEVHKAISVMKRRVGRHARTVHEFRMTAEGLSVGEPLSDIRDVLSGEGFRRDDGPPPGPSHGT